MPATVATLLARAVPRLRPIADDLDEAESDAGDLMAHTLGTAAADPGRRLSAGEARRFRRLAARRATGEPMAYVLGAWPFCGRSFATDRRALIPRESTEAVVERALRRLRGERRDVLVWDVGTGCGAIAITVALARPGTPVLASDVSAGALALARRNARRLGASSVAFVRGDLLDGRIARALARHAGRRLFVVANLPYLGQADRRHVHPEVVAHEPEVAVFAGRHGDALIARFLGELAAWRRRSGRAVTVLIELDAALVRRYRGRARRWFDGARVAAHRADDGTARVLEIIAPPPAPAARAGAGRGSSRSPSRSRSTARRRSR